jgi:hypothetical protein
MIDRAPVIEVLDDTMAAVWRAKSPGERLAACDQMWRFAWGMIAANLRAEHPEWSDEAVRREVVRRMSHGAV